MIQHIEVPQHRVWESLGQAQIWLCQVMESKTVGSILHPNHSVMAWAYQVQFHLWESHLSLQLSNNKWIFGKVSKVIDSQKVRNARHLLNIQEEEWQVQSNKEEISPYLCIRTSQGYRILSKAMPQWTSKYMEIQWQEWMREKMMKMMQEMNKTHYIQVNRRPSSICLLLEQSN